MMEGAHHFIDRKIKESVPDRAKLWNRDFSSSKEYKRSIESNRQHLMKYLGVVDKTTPLANYNKGLPDLYPPVGMEIISKPGKENVIAETNLYKVYQVRWPVLNGVHGMGLLVQPTKKPIANLIAIPDADQTPEQLMGLVPGIPPSSQFARLLVENGFQVLIPVLIDIQFTKSTNTQRMDLPPGVSNGKTHHRIRGSENNSSHRLAESNFSTTQNRCGGLWRGRIAGDVYGSDR
jgi:hypothetical protein